MLEPVLRDHLWPGVAAWIALYVSDYTLTIVCARLHRDTAAAHIVVEGSFELTPQFQGDIDTLRRVSPTFLLAMCTSTATLVLLWLLSAQGGREIYLLALGAMLGVECAVHIRHFRNFHLFKTCFGPDGVRGRVEYPRDVILRISAVEFFQFASLFLLLFLVTGSYLLLGAAAGCLSQAGKHKGWRRAWRERPPQPAAEASRS
jgi:hypothetical protein